MSALSPQQRNRRRDVRVMLGIGAHLERPRPATIRVRKLSVLRRRLVHFRYPLRWLSYDDDPRGDR